MNDQPIRDGELLAFLEGEHLPRVERALQSSPELRAKLSELRQSHRQLSDLFRATAVADPQDLVDVASGQATPAQRLIVAAYVRRSEIGRRDLEELQKLVIKKAAPTSRALPRFTASLLSSAGLRSATADESEAEKSYRISELHAHITIRVTPLPMDRWKLDGHIMVRDRAAPALRVKLNGPHSRPTPRLTDELGFFTFAKLKPGAYRLQIDASEAIVVIPDILLDDKTMLLW